MIVTHELVKTSDPLFDQAALDELDRIAPGLEQTEILGPGVHLVRHGLPFHTLAETLRAEPPVFVRHICPVQARVALGGTPADVETLVQSVVGEVIGWVEADFPFSVQTRLLADVAYKPFAVNNAVAGVVAEAAGAPLDVRNPQQVISIVIIDNRQGFDDSGGFEGLIGLSTVAENLSDWAGGVRRFAREDEQISRSEFKLLEALDVFGLELLPRGTALDLGASPGGWTRVLRQKQLYVTAVDPGELDARLANDRGIRYKRMTAEDYLREEPDPFDVIVNDMRMDGRDSARLMLRYAPYLYPHGVAIVTIKLPERNALRVLDHALNLLRDAYEIRGVRQLFHNRSEVTVVLGKPDRRASDSDQQQAEE